MRTLYKSLTTISLVLALSGMAQAAQLYTPPLQARYTEAYLFLYCYIVNVSDSDRAVTIEVMDSSGTALGEPLDRVLASGHEAYYYAGASSSPSYCKFTVEGNKNMFRASSCIYDDGTCIAAVQAW